MFNWQKHKIIMVRILKEIYSRPEIASDLVFKGGTACHLFYGLNRYSVDLDFDLISPDRKNIVRAELKKILKSLGRLTDEAEKRYTLLFELSYGQKERRLKIEISKRPSLSQPQVLNYLGIPMLVMKPEDIFANKLLALTGRRTPAGRDLFDLYYFFSQQWEINQEIIKKQTGQDLRQYLKKCLKIIERFPENRLLFGLGELVDEKQKRWLKNNLKKDLIFLIKTYLA